MVLEMNFTNSDFVYIFEYQILMIMETKKKLSKEERERILKNVRQSAINYRETNHILDQILPATPQNINFLNQKLNGTL